MIAMKKESRFLIISLIIHAIVFLLSVYIVLPKSDVYTRIAGKIDIDIKIIPQVRETLKDKKKEIKLEKDVEPEKENKSNDNSKSEPNELNGIKLANQELLSLFAPSPIVSSERSIVNIEEKRTELRSLPQFKPIESPILSRPINSNPEKSISILIPSLDQNIGNISTRSRGYKGSEVSPLSLGNSYGRGQSSRYIEAMGSVFPRYGSSQYADILPIIANGIIKRISRDKVDIIFIIDTTGSMEDNVLGVKQYIYNFLNPLKEKKIDVNLGLVEFSDISSRKEKVYGLTDDPEKFKKWLDKTVFYGGGDLPESGYEAIITALEKIKFRKSAQRIFIFISDSPQHDLDYDGKSRYTLDRIISKLIDENVSVDVIGIDDLTLKQLARGTGGQWKPIPGGDPRIDIPQSSVQKIFSKLTVSSIPDLLEDKVIVLFDDVVPDWVDLTYKVLDPNGLKVIGALTYRKEVTNKSERKIEIPVTINISVIKNITGVYTLIYRTKDSYGNQNILRQTFELIQM